MAEKKVVAEAITKKTGTKVWPMLLQKVSTDPRYRIYAMQMINQTIIAQYRPNGEVIIKTVTW